MKNPRHTIAVVLDTLLVRMVILIGAALLLSAQVAAQPAQPADAAARKDLVLKGDAVCTRCHGADAESPVLAIGKTKHGTMADARTPTCTSCHGASETHINRPAGAKERPRPDRVFGKKANVTAEVQNQACLTCHQGGKRIHWQGSTHASRDTTCTSCHQVHAEHDKVRDKTTQADVCLTCHKEHRAQINRPSRHPIKEGKVACSDCHNPHGSAGPSLMVRDSVNDTCYTCHMEKRGPFVRTHQPVQENCAICHNPHGTTTPNLLRSRPPFLCQQCHEPTSHRGNPASLTGTSTGANTLARGCLNCHTNIHGTNNPADISNERTFRR
jgi:DmsE family decaheme c-type cytochrome